MSRAEDTQGLPSWLVAIAFVGSLAALFGGYWDDAWHTDRGRDSFFILPHIFIYAGVAAIGGALGLWVASTARREGAARALSRPTVRLAAISVALTLASGPIDDVWHRAFGRDAVFWSPPHMLGIVGTMVLGAALLAEIARRGAAWSVAGGGLVVSAASFIVAEYDTDVPQFDEVWYLPALALAASVAFGLVRMLVRRPWASTEAALAHLGFVALTAVFLWTQDFPAPALPLLLAPAVALDLTAGRGWRVPSRTAAYVLALFAAYVPVRNWLGNGVEIDALDVAVGLPLAFVASLPFIALSAGAEIRSAPPRAGVAVGVLVAVLMAVPAGVAVAHDPGQGGEAGTAEFTVRAADHSISAHGRLNRASCPALGEGTLVARRAGEERRSPLALDGCAFEGRVEVEGRGRWFVYAELRDGDDTIETWLPVDAGQGTTTVSEDERFVYRPPGRSTAAGEIVGGFVLYGAMLALLVAAFRLLRPSSHPAATGRAAAPLPR